MRSELGQILRGGLHVSERHLKAEPQKEHDLRLVVLIMNFQIRVAEFKAKLDREERESKSGLFRSFGSLRFCREKEAESMEYDGSHLQAEVGSLSAIADEDCDDVVEWMQDIQRWA